MTTFGNSSTLTALTPIAERSDAIPSLWNTRYTAIDANFATVTTALSNTGLSVANVLDFGAIGNGVVDDTTAIQRAINTGRALIYFPTGSYYITAPLTMATNGQTLYGDGWSSKIIAKASLFCAIGIVASTVRPTIRDLEIQGQQTTEPAGPSPARGIVVGTNSTGTAHSATNWSCFALLYNVHITGVTPGTNGFNLGMHFNKGNKNTVFACVTESLYGTNSSFGYGAVCDADDTDFIACRFLSTIAGQGRHGIYFTNTPKNSRALFCYAEGFQSEAFTSNITASGTNGYDLAYIECVARDCMATETGASSAVFAFTGGRRGRILHCRALGTTKGSNNHGFTVANCPESVVDDFFGENISQHGGLVTGTSDDTRVLHTTLREFSLASAGTYGGLELITATRIVVDDFDATVTSGRFVIRFNAGAVPSSCRITNIKKSGSYSFEVENYRLDLTNKVTLTDNAQRLLTLTDAATIAVAAGDARVFTVTLGGNRTVGAPTSLTSGDVYTFTVIQDGTGGRTLAWNAVFKQTWADTGNTLNKRSTIQFVYDGTNFNQVAPQSTYV